MGQWSYLAVMGLILGGTAWLEVGLRTRVYRRWRRLVLTLVPVVAVFLVWDAHAIARGHWWFDESMITGLRMPGNVPIDELVFFVVVPIAAVLTLEAVRSATGLPVGDEAPGTGGGDEAPGTGGGDGAPGSGGGDGDRGSLEVPRAADRPEGGADR